MALLNKKLYLEILDYHKVVIKEWIRRSALVNVGEGECYRILSNIIKKNVDKIKYEYWEWYENPNVKVVYGESNNIVI